MLMSKQNKYIALTILCIFSVILIESSLKPLSGLGKGVGFNLDKEKIITSPKVIVFGLLSLVYLGIIFVGIGQLIIFTIRKFKNKALVTIREKIKPFPLSEEKASELLLLVTAFLSFTYSLPILLHHLRWQISINLLISLNMLLQIAVILVVCSYLKVKNLGISINKKYTSLALRLYCASLPILLITVALNHWLVQKLGLSSSLNPAIQLLLLLKSKVSLSLLIIQVVILGPLAEELFFRGFIYKLFRTRFGFFGAALVVSVFFSLLHRVPDNILPLFALGMILCYIYEKSQDIYPCFLFHSLFNAINLCFVLTIKDFI